MNLPSHEYINEDLYERYAVPSMIREHCERVRDVGMVIALGVQATAREVDVELVDRICLVHDAMKAVTLPPLVENPDYDYVPTEREIKVQAQLQERYPKGIHETLIVADILRPDFPEFSEHVANIGSTGNPTYLTEGIELKIAHYADWRVQHDRIVPFDERLQYLKDTYLSRHPEKGDDWWQNAVQDEKRLESEIFAGLSFTPDELDEAVQAATSA